MKRYPHLQASMQWNMRAIDFEKAYYLVKEYFHDFEYKG